ncbi:hypothetical protein [Streptosporangium sp. NPDC087985]|uniref:hypothetical protein n=1 Tax=Streptosporangium sp. NPDC087985 TaxID=3366196 RepID=UPI0038184F1F
MAILHNESSRSCHVRVTSTRSKKAAALIVESARVQRNTEQRMSALAPMFARVEPRTQTVKYIRAVMSDLPKRNSWMIAEWIGDRSPDATQRLLNRAGWDTLGAMSAVRRFAIAGLDAAARPGSLTVGVLDGSGQERRAAPQQGSSASTWAARAASATASTPCTWPMSALKPATR